MLLRQAINYVDVGIGESDTSTTILDIGREVMKLEGGSWRLIEPCGNCSLGNCPDFQSLEQQPTLDSCASWKRHKNLQYLYLLGDRSDSIGSLNWSSSLLSNLQTCKHASAAKMEASRLNPLYRRRKLTQCPGRFVGVMGHQDLSVPKSNRVQVVIFRVFLY